MSEDQLLSDRKNNNTVNYPCNPKAGGFAPSYRFAAAVGGIPYTEASQLIRGALVQSQFAADKAWSDISERHTNTASGEESLLPGRGFRCFRDVQHPAWIIGGGGRRKNKTLPEILSNTLLKHLSSSC